MGTEYYLNQRLPAEREWPTDTEKKMHLHGGDEQLRPRQTAAMQLQQDRDALREQMHVRLEAWMEKQEALQREIKVLRKQLWEVEEKERVAQWDKEALEDEMKKSVRSWYEKQRSMQRTIMALTAEKCEMEQEKRWLLRDNEALQREASELASESRQLQRELTHKLEAQNQIIRELQEQVGEEGGVKEKKKRPSLSEKIPKLCRLVLRKKKKKEGSGGAEAGRGSQGQPPDENSVCNGADQDT